jgi:phosphate-selective porin OprO/OprP
VSTLRFGFGFLTDGAAFWQDEASEQQVTMSDNVDIRDFRVLLRGRFKTKRLFSWQVGYMYDGNDEDWYFRQTGFQIGFPEVGGTLFVGRTKEGYSLIKVMVGYHGWTMERSPTLDAFVPILADGVRWSGYHPGPHVFYQIGVYGDELSESEKFSTFDHQVVARLGWLPVFSKDGAELLHVAVMSRYAQPDEHQLQVRSRPESNIAPYFLDTGKFPADRVSTTGVEAYYRNGPWLCGAEYNWDRVGASSGEKPLFHGGDTVVAWNITGETRPYNPAGAVFGAVSPERTVFEGGPGAWEVLLHFSHTDFDSGSFTGGRFWKLTPMVNWHLSDNVRMELGYGYGVLNRFGITGHTHFVQARLQFTL